MSPQRFPLKLAAWLHPDGWIEVHLDTQEPVPPSHLHRTMLPRIRLQIDGCSVHYLNPFGSFENEPTT